MDHFFIVHFFRSFLKVLKSKISNIYNINIFVFVVVVVAVVVVLAIVLVLVLVVFDVVVAVVEYYYILIIIIVVGPGAWLSHSAAEGYRFLSKVVATLERNAGPPNWLDCCCCFPPPKKCNSVQ